jgi:hypothetical protein
MRRPRRRKYGGAGLRPGGNVAFHDVTAGGMTPQAATEKAFRRIDEIFAKYQIKAG